MYLVYLQRCLLSIVVVIWIQFPTVAPSEASEQLSFFWPLLAATMNHIIAGSLHVSFFQMVPLMPTQDAMMVRSGKMNLTGQPMASARALMSTTTVGVGMSARSKQLLWTLTNLLWKIICNLKRSCVYP